MTNWKEINEKDLAEKLGENKKTNVGNGDNGEKNKSSKKREQIKLKRIVVFYGYNEQGEVNYDEAAKRVWVYCGRTGDYSHYGGDMREHYNQFAIVEIDGTEYMVRWHKQFTNTNQKINSNIDYVDNIKNKDEGKTIQEFITESGDFHSLVGKSFWIEDENLINGIKKATPNINDKDQKWLLRNVGIFSKAKEYQHRVGESKRCLLVEFDLGRPQISDDISNKKSSKTNEPKSSKNEGSSSTSSSSQTSQAESTFTEEDVKNEAPKKPGQNPSKSLLIRYKVVNIYKLSDMTKLGRKLFRTKLSTGATIGGAIGGGTAVLLGILGAPVTGGASLLTLGAVGGLAGGAVGAGVGWAAGEITDEHENLSQRGGIAFGVESGFGLTDKAYQAEYTIIQGEGGAKELCGNSIVPYIAKGADAWKDPKTKKYGCEASGDFILNPDPKNASTVIAKHYKERHCYFNFQAFGDDDFAKYWGITPIDNDPNKYGIKWKVAISNYVGWRINIKIGEQKEVLLHYDGLIKEDYDNSGGLARWVAQGMIMMGTAYIGGKLLAQPAVAAATTAGQAKVDRAQAYGEKKAATPYLDKQGKSTGRVYGWKQMDTDRVNAAQEAMDTGIAQTANSYQARTNARMMYTVGRSFAGATRLFSGGKGSYTSGINEFIHNKTLFPPLQIEARTSKIYWERWTREMNKRIADWDFYFGDDPELAEKKDFGKCQGIGRQVFANAHGRYQLSEQTIFPQASPNPFIDYMKKNPVFIYTKCCGKQPHESTCERPRLTKDDFFSGFETELTETISREGRKEVVEWTTTEEHTETNTQYVQPTFGFVFAWCGSLNDPTNKIPPLGGGMGTAGAFRITVFNGDTDAEKGKGKIGESGCHIDTGHSDSTDINPFRGRQYHEIYWGRTSPSVCGELEFGKGDENCNYLVTRFALSNKKAETIQTKKTEESWVLWYDPAAYSAAGGLVFSTRSTTTETRTHRIERNFNPLNISNTISLKGFSGLESWGDNPPDAFGGGRGIEVGIPLSSAAMKEEVGGISVKLPQNIGLIMPEEIQSALNTEDVKVDLQLPEIQKETLQQAQQQQEQIFQHLNIGISEQNINTERGQDTSTQKTTDQEKIKNKKITE